MPPPFSTSIQDGYLEVGEIMQAGLQGTAAASLSHTCLQVDVVFRPDKAEQYEPSPRKRCSFAPH